MFGRLDGEGVIDAPLDGKSARTIWQVVSRRGEMTLLRIRLETGRLHQIRRHLAGIGHPVVGDARYGGASDRPLQLLAQRLCFDAPDGARRCFEVDEVLWRASGVRPR